MPIEDDSTCCAISYSNIKKSPPAYAAERARQPCDGALCTARAQTNPRYDSALPGQSRDRCNPLSLMETLSHQTATQPDRTARCTARPKEQNGQV